jgi:hypothetical protein
VSGTHFLSNEDARRLCDGWPDARPGVIGVKTLIS